MKRSMRAVNAKQQKRVLARVIACAALMVLPSCQIPKLRVAEPPPGLPPTFNGATSPNNSAQLRVEEFYNDPVLQQLFCQALATNRELKVLEEEVQVARSAILSRRGAFLPVAGFRANAGVDKPSFFTPEGAAERQLLDPFGNHFPDPMGNFLAGFNFFMPLDIWRELRNARDAARQRYFSAIERRNYFVTRMVADIAENYYGLLALDQRLEILDQTIVLQQQSLEIARARFAAGRGNELAVQRFQAEVRKNQSEKQAVRQEIVEAENRINFLAGRFPQHVDRTSAGFLGLNIQALGVGVPAQLLLNRSDIRQAERELEAAGLDVMVARAHFFPRLEITAGIGYQAFNPKYLFNPDALIANLAGELTAPVLNKAAIQAEYLAANARQLESVYNYQRVVLNAYTEVINRLAAAENYRRSIEVKRQQLQALEASVDIATKLFQNPRLGENARVDYMDVLFAQRDLLDARVVLIDTKRRQLAAIVNAYQALGGGYSMTCSPQDVHPVAPAPQRLTEPLPPSEGQPLPAPRNVNDPPEVQPVPAPREVKDAPVPPLPAPRKEKEVPEPPRLPEVQWLPAARSQISPP
jgi:NodT family efflux transporter outer membrane factor (OMF) lipoprotein